MSEYHRILCVDDDKDCCEMISFMLEMCGLPCSVKLVNNAKEALSILENESFDLYILDYRMPEVSGLELCSKIRKKDKQTPIMFFSAMSREVDRKNVIAAGANDYLVKPNDLDRLTETVKQLVTEQMPVSTSNLQ
jgi:CheY-like chemotaxis protein